MAAHLSALVAVAGLPFGHVLGPLVVYLIKGHQSEFVGSHAKASLNYQITMSIVGIIGVLVFVGAGLGFIFTMPSQDASAAVGIGMAVFWAAVAIFVLAILLLSVIFIIAGTLAASEGRRYSYPFAIRFLR
jgi:uncharacterized Tic20 family protein